jgi:hypothetical protein
VRALRHHRPGIQAPDVERVRAQAGWEWIRKRP